MTTHRCFICLREFDVERTLAMPFCSDRCRQIDMGSWLDERYGVPVESDDGLDEEFESR